MQDIEGDADRVLKDRAVGADPRQDAQAVQGVDQEAGQGSRVAIHRDLPGFLSPDDGPLEYRLGVPDVARDLHGHLGVVRPELDGGVGQQAPSSRLETDQTIDRPPEDLFYTAKAGVFQNLVYP